MNSSYAVSLSAPVHSSQAVPHKNLLRVLKRYRETDYLNSIPKYARDEFSRLSARMQYKNTEIILDSGCGTGESALKLAQLNPCCLVVGVDKSASRLGRGIAHNSMPENVMFIRCDLIHFWRLLQQTQWRLGEHYLFYPNPWPKPGHLQRRWHAHPVFPSIIKLGGRLTMRTNWRVYAEEFALALRNYSVATAEVTQLHVSTAMTAFEKKYTQSGHQLYEVNVNLSFD